MNAELEGVRADGPLTQALRAFDNLGIGEHLPSALREAAEAIAKEQSAPMEDVCNALARFHTNSFRLHNGVDTDSPALTCSGLYDYISRTNHSCDPSVAIVPKSTFCSWRGVPWTLADSGGVLLAYALRDLRAGETVSFNYGPDAMLSEGWDVHRRRTHLKAKLGFECCCSRCMAEAAVLAVKEIHSTGEAADATKASVSAASANDLAASAGGATAKPLRSPDAEHRQLVVAVGVGVLAVALLMVAARAPRRN